MRALIVLLVDLALAPAVLAAPREIEANARDELLTPGSAPPAAVGAGVRQG